MAISGKGVRVEPSSEFGCSANRTSKLTYRKGVLVYSSSPSTEISSNSGNSSLNTQPPPLPLLQQQQQRKTQSSSVPRSANNCSSSSNKQRNNNDDTFPISGLLLLNSGRTILTCSNSTTTSDKEQGATIISKEPRSQGSHSDSVYPSPRKDLLQQHSNNNKANGYFPVNCDSNSPNSTRKYSHDHHHDSKGKTVIRSGTRSALISASSSNKTHSSGAGKLASLQKSYSTTNTAKTSAAKAPKDSTVSCKLATFPCDWCSNTTTSTTSSTESTSPLTTTASYSMMACVNQNRSQQNHHNRHHTNNSSHHYQQTSVLVGHTNHNHHHSNSSSYYDGGINNMTKSMLQNNTIHNQNEQNTNNGFLHNQISHSSQIQQNNREAARLLQQTQQQQEFIPSFVLVDACKSNNDRKVREIVRKLCNQESEDVEPVANFQDNTGRTALSYACGAGNIMIVEELSKLRRLNPNLADNEGLSPLHYAAQAGHSEALDLMLSRFEGVVDLNSRNATGLTPLMKAALQGRTRCAKSLLAAGASAHLRDYSRNLTAAEWATLCGRHICAEIINRSTKDNTRSSESPSAQNARTLPEYHTNTVDLKRMNSDESPYYHLYARNTISGATWLKNKIKKALGASGAPMQYGGYNPNAVRSLADRRPTISDSTYGLMSNLSGATICAGSLLLPSIKPLIDQQRALPRLSRKMTIPTLQVTPVKR